VLAIKSQTCEYGDLLRLCKRGNITYPAAVDLFGMSGAAFERHKYFPRQQVKGGPARSVNRGNDIYDFLDSDPPGFIFLWLDNGEPVAYSWEYIRSPHMVARKEVRWLRDELNRCLVGGMWGGVPGLMMFASPNDKSMIMLLWEGWKMVLRDLDVEMDKICVAIEAPGDN